MTTVAGSARSADALSRWSPSPLIRGVFVLHALAAAILTAEPELWTVAIGALGVSHGLMAALGMVPRNRLLGPNLTRLPTASAARREVALTFDDGPDPLVTPRVLDLLDAHGAKASFFCIGERVEAHPALARDIVRRGHSLENHTHGHAPTFAFSLSRGLASEVLRARDAIEAATGVTPRFFRAPMGLRNPLLDLVMHRTGHRYVSWTRRGLDAVDGNADAVLRRLVRGLAAGDVLVLHDGGSALTATGEPVVLHVLPRLLRILSDERFRPVSLPMACESAGTDMPQRACERPEDEARMHPEEQHVVA